MRPSSASTGVNHPCCRPRPPLISPRPNSARTVASSGRRSAEWVENRPVAKAISPRLPVRPTGCHHHCGNMFAAVRRGRPQLAAPPRRVSPNRKTTDVPKAEEYCSPVPDPVSETVPKLTLEKLRLRLYYSRTTKSSVAKTKRRPVSARPLGNIAPPSPEDDSNVWRLFDAATSSTEFSSPFLTQPTEVGTPSRDRSAPHQIVAFSPFEHVWQLSKCFVSGTSTTTVHFESPLTYNRIWCTESVSVEAVASQRDTTRVYECHQPAKLRHAGLMAHPFWSRKQMLDDVAAFSVGMEMVKVFNTFNKVHRVTIPISESVHLVDCRILLPPGIFDTEESKHGCGPAYDAVGRYKVSWRLDVPAVFTHKNISAVARYTDAEHHTVRALFSAFEHWSFQYTGHRFMCEVVASLGARPITIHVHTNSAEETLDSAVGLSFDSHPFGQSNGGREAILKIAERHRCSEVCRRLKLPPLVVF